MRKKEESPGKIYWVLCFKKAESFFLCPSHFHNMTALVLEEVPITGLC